jgi:hypothetical protein
MTEALVGRAIAGLGVILGMIAIWLDFASDGDFSAKYSDDGTVTAYLLATLILTTLLLAASTAGAGDFDALAAVTGSAAFGFFLFWPAAFGFNHFDVVATGGWLGVCTALIPLGMAYVLATRRATVTPPEPLAALPVLAGAVLCIVAIWLDAQDGGPTYWNFADEGRALPSAMLLLVIGASALAAGPWVWTNRAALDGAVILAATAFGVYEALLIGNAFNEFGRLGLGGWLGSAGGLVLLCATAFVWNVATRREPVTPPAEPAAPPAG